MKKIYLAGKVAQRDWRHDVVPGLHDISGGRTIWPETAAPRFIYTGPYFDGSFGHGLAHGPETHGVIERGNPSIDGDRWAERIRVQNKCLEAICRSDIVFAWLDDDTAYGTLVELGFALAHKKTIIVASPEAISVVGCTCGHCPHDQPCYTGYLADLWFAAAAASRRIVAPSAAEALWDYLDSITPKVDPAVVLLESPIERKFWDEHKRLALPALADLTPQVPALGKYRLDFALPKQKLAIELDGYEYHSGKDAFVKDRARQRELEFAGWRVIRFAGSEIHANVTACVRQAAALAAQ